ncbi:MAG TPA: biopolymer transporter Tol [Ignavibacteria bacterium]|nr:biopolymer transporter Tol [Ignavibacteria bacterium]HMR39918.1 biopolymer transporter Tol [Ignavibacteria bacterium]
MKTRSISLIIFLALLTGILFTSKNSQSQSAAVFGQNKVQYKTFHWKYLKTKHFDVYFYQGGRKLAEFAAHVAEKSLKNLSENLDYNISNRIPFVVFNSHNDFQQNNVIDEYLPEGVGGVTELFKNRINVPFEGDYEKFRHVIHHELLHAFMNDMFYGGTLQNIVSRNISLSFPLWYTEGMAEVQSLYGLDKQTDMFMRDAIINNNVPPLDYIGGYFAYRGGQSFFAYLIDTYGEEKLGVLMNNIKAYNDVDVGFKETYKISLEQLGENWLLYLKKTYWPDLKARELVKDFATQLTFHDRDGGSYNVAPVISPDGEKFAFISNQDDQFDVFIAKTKNGEIIDEVVSGNTSSDFEELHILTPGLSWSPDGKKIALSAKAGDKDVIYIIDIKTEERKTLPLSFDMISYLNWSPVGNKIAFIGSRNEESNLFTYDLYNKKLEMLTDDIFSDSNPTWALDGKSIFFTSDRGDYTDQNNMPNDIKMWEYDFSNTDYYRIDIATRDIDRLSNTKNSKESFGQISPDGKKVLYVSDKNGISNIYLRERDSAGNIIDRPITNSLSPVEQISMSRDGKKLLFVSLNKGGYDIFMLENPLERDLGVMELEPTEFALKMDDYSEKMGREIYSKNGESGDSFQEDSLKIMSSDSGSLAISDSLAVTDSSETNVLSETTVQGNITDETTLAENAVIENDSIVSESQTETSEIMKEESDSVQLYGEDVKISFEDIESKSKAVNNTKDSMYSLNQNFKIEGNQNPDGTYKVKDYKIKFTPDLVFGNASYASFYGVQGIAQIALSDMLGDHRIYIQTSLVIDLKNSDYAVAYYNLANRIDYGFQLYHTARFITYGNGFYNFLYRYRTFGGSVIGAYPISRFNRIDASLGLQNISRENLDIATEPTTSKTILIPSLSYVHDNTSYGPYFNFPVSGTRYNVTVMGSPKFGSEGIGFTSVLGDFRSYFKLSDDYTFAGRFSGGISFGANPMQFFIGGTDNWINYEYANYNLPVSSIEDYAFLSPGLPLRGFDYDQLSGSKYYIMNLEMRFPLFKYLIFGALPLGFANIEGVTFLDMGTAFNDFNEVNLFRNVNGSSQTKDLLVGTGLGARANLFGFPFKFDVAWRYDLDKFSSPKYYISLGYDF